MAIPGACKRTQPDKASTCKAAGYESLVSDSISLSTPITTGQDRAPPGHLPYKPIN